MDRSSVGWPSIRTRPAAGRRRPLRCLTSVVLPEPFWPEDRDGLAGLDGQRDAADGLDAARVAMDEVLDRDRDGRRGPDAGAPDASGGATDGDRARRHRARRSRPSPAAIAASSNACAAGRSRPPRPAGPASAAAVRPRPRPPPAPRPGHRARPARPASSTRQRSIRPRTRRVVLGAQDRGPGRAPARRAGRRPTRSRPDRAGRSARRARGRSCPSPRCSRSRPAAARRRTARTARGRRGGRSPRRASVASIRASISSRGTPRFSSPKASSSRTVSFDADSWLAGVAKTIPTRPEQLAGRPPSPRRCPSMTTRPSSLARTTRGMNPAAARASVDLPAPVRPATPTRSPARDRERRRPRGSCSRRPG